ncbi:MAG: toxin HipA [Bacteroidetes bacterium GWA2_32_17]|nr:MAG: toxin HipA [Bacteroidetes bacterium GWA2_32_17]
MIYTALVKIWGTNVGAVAWDKATGVGSFEYDPGFLKLELDLSPIKMPIDEVKVFSFHELRYNTLFKGLPGLLADVLPDRYGSMLINTWLAHNGRAMDSMNPVELLCFIGVRGMGALEFEPPIYESNNTATKVEINEIIKFANEILSGRKNFSTNLHKNEEKALLDIIKIGTSAGGARAKAVIAYNTQTGEIKSGQANAPKGFSHWLIKFDGVSDKQLGSPQGYGRVEMAYHLMAKDAGIEMSECRLLEENNRAHFMTRRFDRTENNEKLHIQTFCALQHFDFNDVNAFSYEQLFQTLRSLHIDYSQAEQLFYRMVFNVLSRNCDDHTKNFSFIMDKKGKWKLAPAYDICFAYSPKNPWVSHQALSINGKRENFTRNDFITLAKQMNIKKAESIINHIYVISQDWNKYAKQTNVDSKLAKAIQKKLIKI